MKRANVIFSPLIKDGTFTEFLKAFNIAYNMRGGEIIAVGFAKLQSLRLKLA